MHDGYMHDGYMHDGYNILTHNNCNYDLKPCLEKFIKNNYFDKDVC